MHLHFVVMQVPTSKQIMIMWSLSLLLRTIRSNKQVGYNKKTNLTAYALDLYPYSVCLRQVTGCTTGDLAVLYGFVWALFPTQR